MKSRPLFTAPAAFFFLLSFLIESVPGGMITFYLLAAASCLLPIGFSSGWPKYVGIVTCLLFLVLTGIESDRGVDWTRKTTIKVQELKNKTEPDR